MGVGRQSHHHGDAAIAAEAAGEHRAAAGGVLVVVLDVVEQQRRAGARPLRDARDGAELDVPIDLGVDLAQFAGRLQRLHPVAHIAEGDGLAFGGHHFSFTDKAFGGRRDLGDEIAHQLLVRQRRDGHLARLEPRGAGIDRLAVEFHHAFLAGIGVDAGKADRQRRVLVDADPAQPVEHRLAALERHRVGLPTAVGLVLAAPDFQGGGFAHCAATSTGEAGACVMSRLFAAQPDHLVDAPLRQHLREILALVRAAAFGPQRRGLRHRAGDGQHVAQIEPVEPLHVERAAIAERPVAERAGELIDRAECALELVPGAQRPDVVGHGGLQPLQHLGGVGHVLRRGAADQIDRGARGVVRRRHGLHRLGPRGGGAPGLAAEHERLGDGVAGKPVRAVRAADRFARDQQARHLGLHLHVGRDAAHVVVRDRRDLDRHPA